MTDDCKHARRHSWFMQQPRRTIIGLNTFQRSNQSLRPADVTGGASTYHQFISDCISGFKSSPTAFPLRWVIKRRSRFDCCGQWVLSYFTNWHFMSVHPAVVSRIWSQGQRSDGAIWAFHLSSPQKMSGRQHSVGNLHAASGCSFSSRRKLLWDLLHSTD